MYYFTTIEATARGYNYGFEYSTYYYNQLYYYFVQILWCFDFSLVGGELINI